MDVNFWFSLLTWFVRSLIVDCVSSSSVGAGAVTFGFQPCSDSEEESLAASLVASAVLMIFTSPPSVGASAGFFAESGGAIVGFVITGLGAACVTRRERFFRRVCASPSIRQKLMTRHAAMRILT